MTHELSAMEVARLENIKRNEEFMQSLGLETKKKPAPRGSKKTKRHDKDKDYQPGEEGLGGRGGNGRNGVRGFFVRQEFGKIRKIIYIIMDGGGLMDGGMSRRRGQNEAPSVRAERSWASWT
jgi:hypothetical protein